MATVFEVVILICAVFAFVVTYGLADTKQRIISSSVSVALFILALWGLHG